MSDRRPESLGAMFDEGRPEWSGENQVGARDEGGAEGRGDPNHSGPCSTNVDPSGAVQRGLADGVIVAVELGGCPGVEGDDLDRVVLRFANTR